MTNTVRSKTSTAAGSGHGSVSLVGAIAIGVGGMLGAAIYTLLGLAASITGPWIPVAFLVGGLVTAFSVYSYSRLGATFPSSGGAGEFLVRCFGDNVFAGGLNIFQFLGWTIAMSLYGIGFGGYAAGLIPGADAWVGKAFGLGLIVVITLVNSIGSKLVSRSELFVIAAELAILAVFIGFASTHLDPSVFTVAAHSPTGFDPLGILFAAGLLFVAFEGFGVVTNSAGDMARPRRQLPRAMFTALAIVIAVYVLISAIVVMIMPTSEMVADQGHVLATAAQQVMGSWGFYVIAGAALLATASAVNATLYGAANLSYMMASQGQVPRDLTRGVWRGGKVGLFAAAALTMIFIAVFPLAAIGQMASLAFLIIYSCVSIGHLRVRKQTRAKAWPLWAAIILNIALFALLLGYTITKSETATWVTLVAVFALSFLAEWIIRKTTGRHLKTADSPTVPTADSRTHPATQNKNAPRIPQGDAQPDNQTGPRGVDHVC